MNALTIALAYYNNPAMLQEQHRVIAGYPADLRGKTRLIVVDDGSPVPARKAAIEPYGYELEIYRIAVDRPWGQLGARNLGLHVAPLGWVLATDIDHVLPAESAARLLEFEPERGRYYTLGRRMPDGKPTNPHPNSYLMEREWFWGSVGGCDEAFVGYYGTDSIFRRRAAKCGKVGHLPQVELVVYNRDGIDVGGIEGSATRAWGRKRSRWHAKADPIIKRKMARASMGKPKTVLDFPWERVR